jgi:hypothetical protein
MTNNDNVTDLCERLRADALPEERLYHREARCVLGDLLGEAADTLERQAAENKRLREASDGLLAAMFECEDKLWLGRCYSRDEGFRAAALRAVEMSYAARDKYRAALTGEN